jgi:hypothetical protein
VDWLNQNQTKSKLGQILVGKKLISEQQLNAAISQQNKTGQRLGDILAEWKIVTRHQVQGAVRRQRNLRLAATVATALLGPLHAYAAVTAAPVTAARALTTERNNGRMENLSDDEMGEIVGQAIPDKALHDHVMVARNHVENQAQNSFRMNMQAAVEQLAMNHNLLPTAGLSRGDGLQVLGDLATLFNPLSRMLNAETTMKDVVYDPANSRATIGKDGSMTLRLPSTIGEISFRNIRVGNAASAPTFGSIDIKNIDLRGTTITVSNR